MSKRLNSIVVFGVMVVGVFVAPAAGRTYYIDFASGSNKADGLSTARAWRRAPGDALVDGIPAAVRLGAGDRLVFKSGVAYRGSIRVSGKGSAAAPIVYSGSGWGVGPAIMDGSDLLPTPAMCAGAAECLGVPNPGAMTRVVVPAGSGWENWLFGASGSYEMTQFPAAMAGLPYDDISQYKTIPLGRLADLKAGRIDDRSLSGLGNGQPVLALWSRPNKIVLIGDFEATATGITFSTATSQPYEDRDNKFSVLNVPALVGKPGSYAISGRDGIAVAALRAGDKQLSIGSGRNGFLLADGASNIVIQDFHFTHFSGQSRMNRSGVPILAIGGVDKFTISGNHFSDSILLNGQGVITIPFAKALTIKSNRIENIGFGSGIRVGSARGPIEIACNEIANVGRTAIAAVNTHTISIHNNYIHDVNGIHGNGISSYLDNRNVRIIDNVVLDSIRPLTIGGSADKHYFTDDPAEPQTLIAGNILIGNSPKAGALINWGGKLRNVTIRDNQLGGDLALRLQGDESGFLVSNNVLAGKTVFVKARDGAAVEQSGNRVIAVDTGIKQMRRKAMERSNLCPADGPPKT